MSQHERRYTVQKIARYLALIEPLVYRRKIALAPLHISALTSPHELPDMQTDYAGQAIPVGEHWGSHDLNFIMTGGFTVPTEWASHPVALYLPLGDAGDFSHPEALIYIDNHSYAAVDRHHQEIALAPSYADGQAHKLLLHGWTGGEGQPLFMQECAIVAIDKPSRELIVLARNALLAAKMLDEVNPSKTRLLNALDAAFKQLDLREPFGAAFYASVPSALELLQSMLAQAGAALDVDLIAAGHAHIDVAWLWTLGQTQRKTGRTFHTVLRLMEQFPEFHFTQSQPQLYQYFQRDYPEAFEEIKARVQEGRWEAIGGMWIEADCNITGGESLARQFLLGRTYFQEHFGKGTESPVLWLPDVFGYAWNLPQLIKLAGLEYFFTIKIGWNQVNKMPYDSFWWQGLDGTKVLTHFSTSPDAPWSGEAKPQDMLNSATYNANLTAFSVLGSWAKLQHKEAQKLLLMSYGYGDGGGGPTREMNENAQALANFPALPQVKQGKVIDFFRRLETESGQKLPTWNAELYLEIHRGTYTTQSRNKRANRKSEFLLHDTEFLASYAKVLAPDFAYPQATINQAWELICLNQFHDIIPGSSIGAVYTESQLQYEEIRELAEGAKTEALAVLQGQLGGDVLLINPSSFAREDLLFWQGTIPAGQMLEGTLGQQAVDGGTLIHAQFAPYSVQALHWVEGKPNELPSLIAETDLLENAYLRVEFDKNGDICRIYDKLEQREILPEGQLANQWQAFIDRPLSWDAWDIDVFYDDKQYLAEAATSIKVVERGALRGTIEIERRILNSHYTQRISLSHNSARLDFETKIEWRERHILLKVAFPLDLLTPVASYEVQWGHVQRPTHRNTSWDWARFETCAQKWVDLSEENYGVALLNDCKYGHDIQDNVLRLSLLRAPTRPDPEADQGEHHFTYSLFPHGANTNLFDVAAEAYKLNNPLLAVQSTGASRQATAPLLSIQEANTSVIIETVKGAEDGNGLILRLYQSLRTREWLTLQTGFDLQAAYITNLLEENQEAVQVAGQALRLYLKPFQIVTLRLIPKV